MIINKLKSLNSSIYMKQRLIVTAFIIMVVASMSVGYAIYYEELNASSIVILEAPVNIQIYDAEVISSVSATDKGSVMTWEETSNGIKLVVDTNVHFASSSWGGANPTITYQYTIANLSHHAYTFTNMTYSSEITSGYANIGDPVISGMVAGTVLDPGEELVFTASVTMGSILGISYEKDAIIHIELNFTEGTSDVNIGTVESSLSETELLIEDDNIADVTVNLLNIYGYSVNYELVSNNANVTFVDSNGNATTYGGTLEDGGIAVHDIYLKVADGVDLTNGVETTLSVVLANGTEFVIDTVELSLDPQPKWKNASVTYKINKNVLETDEYEITFAVNNNGTKDMTEYTAYLYLDPELTFTSIENNDASIVYIPDEHLLKLSSNIKGTSDHNTIAVGSSYEYTTVKVKMNQTDLIITDKVIYRTGEVFTDNYNYTTATE